MCEAGIKVAEGLGQDTSTPGVHHRQPGAIIDLLPTHACRQEAGATLYWSLLYGSSCGAGSISMGATQLISVSQCTLCFPLEGLQ